MAKTVRSLSQRFSRTKSSNDINGNVNGAAPTKPADKEKEKELVDTFRENVKKGSGFSMEHSTLAAVLDLLRHKDAIDDRKMLLENGLVILSKMPQGRLAKSMANGAIKILYDDLPHPPATYMGKDYQWRKADGSYNNVDTPDVGKANTPYARSVQQGHPMPANTMPDAGLLFDTLLRRESFEPHPAGLSSMMFMFAALVIHTVFQTSHTDVSINETSSYIDLAPLYGDVQEDQDKIRDQDRKGYGLLYPDVFAEDRLMLLPPQCCCLLVLFNRNHNYIAKKIYEINERGNYEDPATLSSTDPAKNKKLLEQDEEIFQTARLCNIAWFGSIVFSDYFSSILGLVRQGSSWSLNPFEEIRNEDHTLFERGRGNVCSVEFNCLYRWHPTTSAHDEKWVEGMFTKLFPGQDPDTLTTKDFRAVAKKLQEAEPGVRDWTFGNMERKDGYFPDQDLANYILDAVARPAGRFGARHTPHIMRLHEIMGIEANRRWGVCNLNEFRKFLGLKPYSSFLEWNSDPKVANTAEKLYGDIENLELYVGLQAEETKPVMEGAGLCPGYTISRAILSDAIALTRGDRFFTHDYTPHNLTTWGFNDCQRDSSGAGFGSMLGRLFLRTLPNHFTENSTYTWFPLMTPEAMEVNLTKLNLLNKYDLNRPTPRAPYVTVKGHAEIAQILGDPETFKTPYLARASTVISGPGFFLAAEDPVQGAKDHKQVIDALANSAESVDKIEKFFFDNTRELIQMSSYSPVVGKVHIVDIVRDVLKYVPVRWAATEIAGIPLKTKTDTSGAYTESELYGILADIYSYIFLEGDSAKQMVLGEQVKTEIKKLLSHIKSHITGLARLSGFVGAVTSAFNKPKKTEHGDILKRLTALGYSHDHLANSILAILVGSTVELSIVLANTLDLVLGSDKDTHLRTLFGDAKKADELQGFAYEALRLEPPFKAVIRIAQKDVTVSSVSIKKNDHVILDIASANLEESVFARASTINPARTPKDRYLIGDGSFKTLGGGLASKIVTSVLYAVMGLPNLRRGPGQSGELRRFVDNADPIIRYAYLDKQLQVPWPSSMTVEFDDAAPASSS